MKRKVLLTCALLAALTLIPAISSVQAAPSVTDWRWDSPLYVGTDTYLKPTGGNVIAYKAGTTASLIIKVYNDLGAKAPFKVRIHMDWNTENKTSDEKEIASKQWYTFKYDIPVPDTTVASNLVLHSYKIYVEYVDGTMVRWITPVISPSSPDFAVYSADQTDAQMLEREYNSWRDSYTGPVGIMSLLGMTAKAKELWTKGAVEDYLGDESYRVGSFPDAKTHYETALNYTKDAITSDIEKTASFEDALIGLVDAGKIFLSLQGYAYLIFGIGFLFIGIGAMVYLIRRSKPPATS